MFKALAGGRGVGVGGLQVNEGVAARELEGKGKGQKRPGDGHSGVTWFGMKGQDRHYLLRGLTHSWDFQT